MISDNLNEVIKELKSSVPSYRIGQILVNSLNLKETPDLFFMSDSELLEKVQKHLNQIKSVTVS